VRGTVRPFGQADGLEGALPTPTTITGLAAPQGEATLDLEIVPRDPLARTTLRLQCPGQDPGAIDLAEPLLWPALTAGGRMRFAVLLRPGYRLNTVADLTGPSGGGLRGQLRAEIIVSR
jgi:hypothetical protein